MDKNISKEQHNEHVVIAQNGNSVVKQKLQTFEIFLVVFVLLLAVIIAYCFYKKLSTGFRSWIRKQVAFATRPPRIENAPAPTPDPSIMISDKNSLDAEEMLPTSVCYICFSLMKKMLQFRDRSQKANQILKQLISSGLEPSVSSLDMLVKDQTSISWTLGISAIESSTTTSGKVEVQVKIESVKSEMEIDGMSDRNEDYPDSMPQYAYRDSTSDSVDDLPVQNTSKQGKTDRAKIEKTLKVILKRISGGHEGATLPEKRKLDNNEAENELVNIEAPLRKTKKDEEPGEKKNYKRIIPAFKKGSNNFTSPLKKVLKETKTTTSNIISEKQNDSAFNKKHTVTPLKDIFTCDLCPNKYQCKILLESHVKTSHVIELSLKNSINSDLNVTNECKSTTVLEVQKIQNNDNRKINKRSKKKNYLRKYECQYCMKRCTSNYKLTNHVRIHTKEKPFKCNICAKDFSERGSLTKHLRVHTKEKPFKCPICGKCFSERSHLTSHLRVHTKEKPFKCDICEKCFSHSTSLKVHSRIHTKEKPYKCKICEKCFSRSHHLIYHLRLHAEERPYKCEICGKCFTQNSSLTIHLRIHAQEKPFICDFCEKCFSDRCNLTTHLRVHTKEKPYKCDICEKRFTLSHSLTKHLRVHTKEKPFKCNKCDKCFSDSSNLTQHLRVHTKEKPFKCEICDKCFSLRSAVASHLKVHTKEKPFKCEECRKCFAHRCSLITHKRIHSGEKPYSCSDCNKRFAQSGYLTIHKRIHSGEKPYSCSYCDKRFSYRCSLIAHLRIHTKKH